MTPFLLADAAANPLAFDYVTMGVTLVVFLLLLAILYFAAWGPIQKGLAKREEVITGARDEALKAKKDAEAMQQKLNAEFAAAQDKIRAMMDEARRDADALKAAEKATGVKEAQEERQRAKRDIELARDQAIAELHQQAVQLSSLMSAKTIGSKLNEDDHRLMLASSIDDLAQTVSKA